MKVSRPFAIRRKRRARKELVSRADPPADSVPRIARLMALAIRFDQLIQDCIVADQANLAQLGRVSRARVTQIMNLLNLVPELQDRLLHLPAVTAGRDPVTERQLRLIAAEVNWGRQLQTWTKLCESK